MDKIKEMFNSLIEKMKSDKKFLGLIIAGILIVIFAGYFIYNQIFSYDLSCYYNEDDEYISIKVKFDNKDLATKFETVTIYKFEDDELDNLDYFTEYYEEEIEEMRENGLSASLKISGNQLKLTLSGTLNDDNEEYFYDMFDDYGLKDFRRELLDEGMTCNY